MNVLRFAIILNGINSPKFNAVLRQVIIGVLYDDYSRSYTITDIRKAIKNKYSLDFSDNDILNAVNYKKEAFVITGTQKDYQFTLTPKTIEKQNKLDNYLNIDKIIDGFFNEKKIDSLVQSEFKQSLVSFFYGIFNSNKEEILALLSGKSSTTIEKAKNLSSEKKELIIAFLEWDNNKKDMLVYSIIKSAYDYCILNLKADSSESIFHSKQFFLDTNVIFSLMGINGPDKEEATKTFIEKCKEIKTELCYTHFTLNECKNTLFSLIDTLESMVKGQTYINQNNFNKLFGKTTHRYLYSIYLNWTAGNSARVGDFYSFRVFIDQQLTKLLNSFSYHGVDKSVNSDNPNVQKRMNELSEHKTKMNRRFTENSIITDACNYVFMESVRNTKSATINGQKGFFITLDSAFVSWSSKENKGIISLVVHPNTMYSVLLRFSNRTDDDYRSFSCFVSLGATNDFLDKDMVDYKTEVLREINSLNETKEIKEQILYFSNAMLIEKTNDYGNKSMDLEPKELVNQGRESVISKLKEDHEKEKEQLEEKHRSELEALEEKKNEEIEQISNEQYNKALKEEAQIKSKRLKTRNIILHVLIYLLIIGGCSCLIAFGIKQLINEGVTSFTGWLQIVVPIIPVVIMFIKPVKQWLISILNKILPTNQEIIFNKCLTKIIEKHNKNKQ